MAKSLLPKSLDHDLNWRWSSLVLCALMVLPFVANAMGESFYIALATRILIFAIAATSLNLILGFGGMVSFGHAAFLGVGAYTVAILTQMGLTDAWLVWPVAMLVAGSFAFLIGAVSLRTQGVYFIMITLAFAQMMYYLVVSVKTYGGDDGMPLLTRSRIGMWDMSTDTNFYYVTLAVCVVIWVLIARLLNARFGHVLQAIRQRSAYAVIGIRSFSSQVVCFCSFGGVGWTGWRVTRQSIWVCQSCHDAMESIWHVDDDGDPRWCRAPLWWCLGRYRIFITGRNTQPFHDPLAVGLGRTFVGGSSSRT
jgi:branched-chain amino acid transport system permease protein